jgi:hypothetical protein
MSKKELEEGNYVVLGVGGKDGTAISTKNPRTKDGHDSDCDITGKEGPISKGSLMIVEQC